MGDLNVKSPQWGSPVEDVRGEYLTEWMATLNIVVHNTGLKPTFVRGNSKSYIDITSSTERIGKQIVEWKVLDEETLSDHSYIYFEIKGEGSRYQKIEKTKILNDWEVFRYTLEWRIEERYGQVLTSQEYTEILKEAYENSVLNKGTGLCRQTPYWWNTDIDNKRKECIRTRRKLTRSRRNGVDMETCETYKQQKKELQSLIARSKRKHWKDLCLELNNNIWGNGYKIVMGLLTNLTPYRMDKDTRKEVVTKLFPSREDTWENTATERNINPFTKDELIVAAEGMKNGKAPGVDGIPPEAVKEAVKVAPDWILDVMNRLLKAQEFPIEWKMAKLILIPKEKKPTDTQVAVRPLCLLNTLSKLYEALIRLRLEKELKEREGLSENQFGFRKGRSCIQAAEEVSNIAILCENRWCVLITLDVQNAFNSAAWSVVIKELRKKGISNYLVNVISKYFEHRKLQLDKKEVVNITAGVPQGSVLGPTLWNILYDGVLRLKLCEGVNSIGFADDLAIVVRADDIEELQMRANESLRRIKVWMKTNHLELAPQKTEAVILKGSRKKTEISFELGNVTVKTKNAVQYLGITFDYNNRFGEHIKRTVLKAEKKTSSLGRIMPNIGGPRFQKREILCGVVQSILLYGVPVWYKALKVQIYRGMLTKAQRKILIRVASAYKTVSTSALQVITGIPPIELLAEERKYLHEQRDGYSEAARSMARENTLNKWQWNWEENIQVAQWTKKLIPDVRDWTRCNHKELNYWLTQVLTGHGSFKSFTHRIGKTSDARCDYCNEEDDTPEHTLFYCVRWERYRQEAELQLGKAITVESLAQIMCTDRQSWNILQTFIKKVMDSKEKAERCRQQIVNI